MLDWGPERFSHFPVCVWLWSSFCSVPFHLLGTGDWLPCLVRCSSAVPHIEFNWVGRREGTGWTPLLPAKGLHVLPPGQQASVSPALCEELPASPRVFAVSAFQTKTKSETYLQGSLAPQWYEEHRLLKSCGCGFEFQFSSGASSAGWCHFIIRLRIQKKMCLPTVMLLKYSLLLWSSVMLCT